jgi:SAM-dependent methyltransferase
MTNFKCRVCDNSLDNKEYIITEMMFGTREQFKYVQCALCSCLQIAEIPSDMQPYYPPQSYYSYRPAEIKKSLKSKIGLLIRKRIMDYHIDKFNILGFLATQFSRYKNQLEWIKQLKGLKYSSEILDIGCGSGSLLIQLNELGFSKLTGIDPFIDGDINYKTGVQILKKNISELDKKFDVIMLHHAFEHMDNPNETFNLFYKFLKPDGRLLIRIPLADSFCWRKYGVSWFQIDAPRHFFIHTVRSISFLAKHHGFDISSIEYDSTERQFYGSEKYIRDKALFENVNFKAKMLNEWKKQADWLNKINDGDQACFVLFKSKND